MNIARHFGDASDCLKRFLTKVFGIARLGEGRHVEQKGSGISRLFLEEAFEKQGCPICNLLRNSDIRTIDSLLYEFVNDVQIRHEIRKTLGFCNYHSWILHEVATDLSLECLSTTGAAVGIAIIYLDLVDTIAEKLKSAQSAKLTHRISLKEANHKTGDNTCRMCSSRSENESAYLQILLKSIGDRDFLAKYSVSDGLCAIHLQGFMMQEGFHQHKKALAAVEIRRLNTLSSDLREFLRKKDYRYAKEAPGKEADSWLRALRKVSGERFAAPMKRPSR